MKEQLRNPLIALTGLACILVPVYFIKAEQFKPPPAFAFPPEVVTSAQAESVLWKKRLISTGTIKAVNGVQLSSESPGKVSSIRFDSGQVVKKNDLLIQLNDSNEQAQLASAIASAELAQLEWKRAKKLYASSTISQAELDAKNARALEASAQVNALKGTVSKKQIRAPFDGTTGICQVNIGEHVYEGKVIVSIQDNSELEIDFEIPQRKHRLLSIGQLAKVSVDSWEDEIFKAEINAIEPDVDTNSRMIGAQAKLSNPMQKLKAGMFAEIIVESGDGQAAVIVPTTAVIYHSYGNSIFVIKKGPDGQGQTVEERMVRLGEQRGDFIRVLNGVEAGEEVVATGAFKLSNGSSVIVDNSQSLKFEIDPQLSDS